MFRVRRRIHSPVFPDREVLSTSEIEQYSRDVSLVCGVDPWAVHEVIGNCQKSNDQKADSLFKIAYAAQLGLFRESPNFPLPEIVAQPHNATSSRRMKVIGSATLACFSAGFVYGVWKVSGQILSDVDLDAYRDGYDNFIRTISGRN